jgi:ABC-2 type transport system ATP-binding protein
MQALRNSVDSQSQSSVGSTGSPPLLQIEGLSVRLGGRTILDRLDATITGRIVGLLGPNGAGKTTLIRTLLGYFKPSAGHASVLGHSLEREGRTVSSIIGYMPEDDAFISGMSAVRFVRMMGELSGLPPDAALERTHDALTFVGMGENRYRRLGSFSTGMKQMVKLAQALVHGPRLLMLDEPTNGLDPAARHRMIELIQDIGRDGRTGVLLSSHLLGDVEAVCDEVMILKAGRLAGHCDLASEHQAARIFVDLETLPPSPQFKGTLERLGCSVEDRGDGRFRVELPAAFEVRSLFAAAAEEGLALRRFERTRDSLQDIFLRAMEDEHGRS